jgi:hypothetical protein
MSWIFGFYSKQTINNLDLSNYHPKSISFASNSKYYIAIGGNNNTIIFNSENPESNFFVCGFAFTQNGSKILDKSDWKSILFNSPPPPEDLNSLNGHFCGVFIKNDSITLFTDQLGLREFHIYENNEGWYFSTRLDWLLQIDDFEIDFGEFGSRWLLINQLSNKSIIKKIHRLNCGAKAVIKNNRYEIVNSNWIPQKSNILGTDEFIYRLEKNILLGVTSNKKISLSLSGGMDSRVLLSFLLNSKNDNWDCHTFQTDFSMDGIIAAKISKDLNIKHKIISQVNPDLNNIIPELFEYVGITYLTNSGFASRKLMLYKYLTCDEIIIDGGFGEIWRREFSTRLYILGKKDLENNNYAKIPNYLVYHRADIFSEEYDTQMKTGIVDQIEKVMTNLPSIKEIGLENWLDLFTLKTRLVNCFAHEQARIDNYVTAYMPFTQLNLLNDLLNIPVEERNNNRLYKKFIRSNCKRLSKYNLARGEMFYPFYFTPLMKRSYLILYDKFTMPKENKEYDLFLLNVKEFLMDLLLSKSAIEYTPYNYKLIYDNVISYYSGNYDNRHFVNWFLTFEIFRQIIQGKT